MREPLFDVIDIYEDDNIKLIQEQITNLYPITVAFNMVTFLLFFILIFHFIDEIQKSFLSELYLLSIFLNHDPDAFKNFLDIETGRKEKAG